MPSLTCQLHTQAMRAQSVSEWFDEYLASFAACGRGEREAGALVEFYGVPLLLSTDAGYSALITEDQVVRAIQQQIDGLRAAAYDRSEVLDSKAVSYTHLTLPTTPYV